MKLKNKKNKKKKKMKNEENIILIIIYIYYTSASVVLPVPGGPNNNIPFHGCLNPLKKLGSNIGNIAASYSTPLASLHIIYYYIIYTPNWLYH